jgi:zona occludens toxin
MTQKFSTTEITINDTYFDLYTSGNKSNQRAVGQKYIIMFIIYVLFLICLFALGIYKMYFNNSFPEKVEQTQTPFNNPVLQTQSAQSLNNAQTNQIVSNSDAIQHEESNLKLFKFNCFQEFCYYKTNNITIEIPHRILKSFLTNIPNDKTYFQIKNNRLLIYILIDEQKFNFLKGVQNENETNTIDNLNLTGLTK